MPLVQIIIPNWNGCPLLKRCLTALNSQTFKDFSIIVVDNGSRDDCVTWLREHAPKVQVIANTENRGFAAAINQGIRAGTGEYVATLNNDTEPTPTWLESLVTTAQANPAVGMFASKMLFADQAHAINSAGICIDRAGIAWDCLGGTPNTTENLSPTEVFGPCAGAALYRRKMLDDVGLFDEAFFAYLEDVDLAWRARLAGWHALYVPSAQVYHVHSGTLGEGSPFKNFLLGRNKVWLLLKDYPMPYALRYLPTIIFYDLLAVLYALLARKDVHALRGRLAGLMQISRILPKRRLVQSQIRDLENWARFMQPVVPPWRVSQRYRHLRSRIKQDSIS